MAVAFSMKSIKVILEHRRLPLWAAVLGTVLASSSLNTGFLLDDYFHRATILGSDQLNDFLGEPQEMFRFIRGNPQRTHQAIDVGILPWWTYPELKGDFFRPLTVQTHLLDYALWPHRPFLMHLHSLLWLAALIFLVGLLFRRILGPTWIAGLATLLFAVEDAHAIPAGWIANRSVLLATVFGVACLLAHDRWTQKQTVYWYLLALILWLASLCSGEAGIATSALVFAYVVWLQRTSLRHKFLSLLPYGVILVGWRIIRNQLGHGVHGLGPYVDPLDNPLRFIAALVERAPALIAGQWTFPPSDLFVFAPGMTLWSWAVIMAAVLTALFWPLLRRDRTARFFATMMLLSLIPICATMASDRLLTFVGIGAFGLLAQFTQFSFSPTQTGNWKTIYRRLVKFSAGSLLVLHLAVAPILLVAMAANPLVPEDFMKAVRFETLPSEVADRDLVLVNSPFPFFTSYYMLRAELDGLPLPQHLRSLATGLGDMTIVREDEKTIVIVPDYGFNITPLDQLVRSEQHPLKIGDQVKLSGMTAEVLSVSERATKVRFRFDVPLEDSSLYWLRWREGKFEPFVPPAIGKSTVLRAPPVKRILMSDYQE